MTPTTSPKGQHISVFKFSLNDKVSLAKSGEAGEVIARAKYADSQPLYLVCYVAADGRQVREWWEESQITRDLTTGA